MKAIGIVRRIDDLGHIAIPKEIRRVMELEDGAPLEIHFDNQKGIIYLQKYAP